MKDEGDGYQLAEEFTLLRRGAAIKLFNKDGYSLGTYVNGVEVNDVRGCLLMSTIGPNESVPILDILPSSFQIGSWDEDLERFEPDGGATEMKDLAELQRLVVLSPRSSKK